MLVRTVCILALLAAPAFAQRARREPVPPKPKVVATPKPTPARRPAAPPVAEPTTPTPKPAARKPRAKTPSDPLAAYMPTVKAAFTERWGDAVTPLLKGFDAGILNVLFKLDAAGQVTDFQVVQNTSNDAFAKFCEKFVRETVFETPPEKALVDGQVEIPFTFSIY